LQGAEYAVEFVIIGASASIARNRVAIKRKESFPWEERLSSAWKGTWKKWGRNWRSGPKKAEEHPRQISSPGLRIHSNLIQNFLLINHNVVQL